MLGKGQMLLGLLAHPSSRLLNSCRQVGGQRWDKLPSDSPLSMHSLPTPNFYPSALSKCKGEVRGL